MYPSASLISPRLTEAKYRWSTSKCLTTLALRFSAVRIAGIGLSLLLILAVRASAQTITVYTANLQHGTGTDLVTNYPRQVTALSTADLIGVQERTTGDTGWDASLSSAGFVQAIFRENAPLPSQGDGPAIWYKSSTVTINAVYQTDLSSGFVGLDGSTDVDKAAVGVKATISGRPFYFFATHLCWSQCADSAGSQFSVKRESQIQTLLSWIAGIVGSDRNVIIVGDMNFGPDYPRTVGNGGGLIKDYFTEAGYSDLWNTGLSAGTATTPWGDRDANGTVDMTPANLGTQTTGTRTHDTRRIDYMFLKSSATLLNLNAITVPDGRATCSVALTANGTFKECPDVDASQQSDVTDDQGVRPSDHNFVRAVLNLGSCQPPTYCANTSTTATTMPTQTPPALNASFVDTVASKTVFRLTDATVLASLDTAYNNQQYQVSSGSEQNAWSKSFTSGGQTHYRYYVERVQGGTPHFFDINGSARTGSFINGWANAAWPTATNFPGMSGGTWSYANDGYFYAHDNATSTTLRKYDFNAKTITTIKDWSTGCGVTLSSGHIGEPTVDVTDTYFSTYGGGASQDRDQHVVIWKVGVGGGCRWINTETLTVGGDWGVTGAVVKKNSTGGAATWPQFYIHNARLSPDGNYVRMTGCTPIPTPTECGNTIYVWDVNTLDVKACVGSSDKCFGHTGWAWTKMVNQENSSADAIRYAARSYADLSPTGITYVAQPSITPAENMADSHLSSAYSNAQQTALITCGSAYRTDGSPPNGFQPYTRQHRPFDNEVFCMTLNAGANAMMYRFTHTFTSARYPSTEVTCSSVSRSGTTVSATCVGHGLTTGQTAIFTHTASGALDGFCGNGLGGVTVTGADTFTCTDERSGTVAAGTARVSSYQGAPFEALPRGNMSQDGRFYAFASDFMGQLGNTVGGTCAVGTNCRTDVFIVELAPVTGAVVHCNWSNTTRCQ